MVTMIDELVGGVDQASLVVGQTSSIQVLGTKLCVYLVVLTYMLFVTMSALTGMIGCRAVCHYVLCSTSH